MTEKTQPTDALAKLRHLYANMINGGVRDTASAKRIAEGLLSPAIEALEKWGTPAGAGEPDAVAYLDIGTGYLDLETVLSEEALLRLPKGRHVLVIAGTYGIDGYAPTPQPTQAQAGAVPLTDEQREAIWQECRHDNGEGWEVDCWEVIDAVERVHGIKGGQHGTE